jgi:hypothetical protein
MTRLAVVAILSFGVGAVASPRPTSTPNELAPTIAEAWEFEIAWWPDLASPILARVMAALAPDKGTIGLGDAVYGKLIADGKLVALSSPAENVLVFDAATGMITGIARLHEAAHGFSIVPVKKTELFLTYELGDALVVREALTARAVIRFEHVPNGSAFAAADDGSVLVVAVRDELVVYDLKTRKITRRSAVPHALGVSLGNNGKSIIAEVGEVSIVYDTQTGQELARQPQAWYLGQPAFAPDGKTIALVADRKDNDWNKGVRLVDRATRNTLATSSACGGSPSSLSFSADGKYLAVGDIRRACILDAKSLKLVAQTPEIRSGAGPGDDLQHTRVSFVHHLLVAATDDGTVGIYTVPGMKKRFNERGFLVQISGKPVVATEDQHIVSIAADGSLSRRAMTPKERARGGGDEDGEPSDAVWHRIDPNVCRVRDWLLPRAACD